MGAPSWGAREFPPDRKLSFSLIVTQSFLWRISIRRHLFRFSRQTLKNDAR
jgi:hypothetical protein